MVKHNKNMKDYLSKMSPISFLKSRNDRKIHYSKNIHVHALGNICLGNNTLGKFHFSLKTRESNNTEHSYVKR